MLKFPSACCLFRTSAVSALRKNQNLNFVTGAPFREGAPLHFHATAALFVQTAATEHAIVKRTTGSVRIAETRHQLLLESTALPRRNPRGHSYLND